MIWCVMSITEKPQMKLTPNQNQSIFPSRRWESVSVVKIKLCWSRCWSELCHWWPMVTNDQRCTMVSWSPCELWPQAPWPRDHIHLPTLASNKLQQMTDSHIMNNKPVMKWLSAIFCSISSWRNVPILHCAHSASLTGLHLIGWIRHNNNPLLINDNIVRLHAANFSSCTFPLFNHL